MRLLDLFCGAGGAATGYQIGVYGSKPDGRRVSYRHHRLARIARGIAEARSVMGIDWMDWGEITQAVPPVYTQFLGEQLLAIVERMHDA